MAAVRFSTVTKMFKGQRSRKKFHGQGRRPYSKGKFRGNPCKNDPVVTAFMVLDKTAEDEADRIDLLETE